MTLAMEEPSCSSAVEAIDLISAVKGLHGLSSLELHKLLRDSENFTIHYLNKKGSSIKIDMEKLAGFLPLHLMAVLMSSDKDETLFRYLLSGIRLLHSLCDLAPRHTKLEQILLDDVKELCEKGGVLFLARAILKLNVTPPFVESSRVVAAVSRLKAKVLSILLSLCESESLSYLDDVASSPGSLDLAKSVALEVFGLLKTELGRDPEHPRQGQEIQKEMQII